MSPPPITSSIRRLQVLMMLVTAAGICLGAASGAEAGKEKAQEKPASVQPLPGEALPEKGGGALPASKPAASESKSPAAGSPAPATTPWRLVSLYAAGSESRVMLSHAETGAIKELRNSPDANGERLIHATVGGRPSDLQIRVTIGGKEVTVTEPALAQTAKTPAAAARTRGPSDEDRRKYESLSEAGKQKLREFFRGKFSDEGFRNLPEEERRAVIRDAVERLQKEDAASRPSKP